MQKTWDSANARAKVFYTNQLDFFFLKKGSPIDCRYNNRLYRSGLDPLSATNLCYDKLYFLYRIRFLKLFFL